MNKTVLIIAETEHGELTLPTLECVEEGRELADSLNATVRVVLPGCEIAALVDTLAAHGADTVTLVEHEALAQFSADGWLSALAPVLHESSPTLVLAPDSGYIRAWLPRLSARWRVPLVSGCIQVKLIADGYPEMIRSTHNGARQERLIWPVDSMVAALLTPGVRGVGMGRPGRHAEVRRVTPELHPETFRDRTLRTLPPDPHTVDIGEAERIVSGGLGVGGPEGMQRLQRLADLLNAALGGTRVVSDRGWLAVERFIGATGKIVAPKLYLGFGISGAGQHVAGITGSETVVAVNIDRTSPLLKMADLGIVGDLHQIVPALLAKLERLQRAPTTDASSPSGTESSPRVLESH
ncbi:MAG: electron transfer flavoprotein subunit alpha/FixB family protein [Gammaproteobacteria bacterium]|nr:electron transfer flavoprotein subunit alpha/FixB family protein [Gammaproteobacteria bacterium]